MTVILPQFHHCDCKICEWLNSGIFFKFPCIVRIYAWFFMHCRNHHSDNHTNHVIICFNSLAPGRFQINFRKVIFKLTLVNGGWSISHEIALRRMPLGLTDDKSTLVQVIAWCHQATSHYLRQCWPRSMSSNGTTRPQWVNVVWNHAFYPYSSRLLHSLFRPWCWGRPLSNWIGWIPRSFIEVMPHIRDCYNIRGIHIGDKAGKYCRMKYSII